MQTFLKDDSPFPSGNAFLLSHTQILNLPILFLHSSGKPAHTGSANA